MEEDKIFGLLEEADWQSISNKLLHYAANLLKKYTYTTSLRGKSPEDIVVSAIEKVFNKTRAWDPEKYPVLLTHLKWIVRSDISHLFEKKSEVLYPDIDSPELDAPVYDNPEKSLILKEHEETEENLITKLYDAVSDSGDSDLETLLLLIHDGVGKPAELAEKMEKEVSEIYTLKRKLIRIGKRVRGNEEELN